LQLVANKKSANMDISTIDEQLSSMATIAPTDSVCHQPPPVPPPTTTCEQHTISAESSADLDGCIHNWLGAIDLEVWFVGCHIPSTEVI
jgi:hypothetical protein